MSVMGPSNLWNTKEARNINSIWFSLIVCIRRPHIGHLYPNLVSLHNLPRFISIISVQLIPIAQSWTSPPWVGTSLGKPLTRYLAWMAVCYDRAGNEMTPLSLTSINAKQWRIATCLKSRMSSVLLSSAYFGTAEPGDWHAARSGAVRKRIEQLWPLMTCKRDLTFIESILALEASRGTQAIRQR